MKRISTLIVFLLFFGVELSSCQYLKRDQALLITKTTVGKTTDSPKIPEEEKKEPKQQIDQKPKKQIDLEIIVSYFRFLNSLPPKSLKEEHRRTHQEFAQDKSPTNRLRLAMLLGFTNAKHRDTKRSLSLLKTYLDDPNEQDPILRDFSFLLASFVQQIKTQERETQKLSLQLKKERQEKATLKRMIEELKTIEKNLIKRDTMVKDE